MAIRFFGQFLLAKGVITARQLAAAIEQQQQNNLRLGEYAVDLGYITSFEADRINAHQMKKDVLFGTAAKELGLLNDEQLSTLVTAQQNNHVLLGEALESLGFVTREQLDQALTEFMQDQAKYAEMAINIPPEVPMRALVSRAFDLAEKQFLRLWNIRAKAHHIEVVRGQLPLSERNAQVAISGQWTTRFILGAPDTIADAAARHVMRAESSSAEERDDVVGEFGNVICGNLVAMLAAEGKTADISPPEQLPGQLDLADAQAVVLSYATHAGTILVALTF